MCAHFEGPHLWLTGVAHLELEVEQLLLHGLGLLCSWQVNPARLHQNLQHTDKLLLWYVELVVVKMGQTSLMTKNHKN